MSLATAAGAADSAEQVSPASSDRPLRVTIYPILVKAPIFGASIKLPSIPSGGGSGEAGEVSGKTDVALNTAYMAGLLIESNRLFAEATGLWAALSAERDLPRVNVDTDTYFLTARGGVRLFGGFSVTGAVRRVSVDLNATLTLPELETVLEGKVKPAVWDPLIGVDYRKSFGGVTVDGNVQGGGFGGGADEDISAEIHGRFRIVPHMELRAGYSMIYFKLTVADVNIGAYRRTLIAKQSMHGPEIGLGIVF
jgi:hypothetical protein